MDSATRCYFVNPNYDELHGQPCFPSLDALPERPDVAILALNPLRAATITEAAAAAGVPAVIIPGGGVVEGGAAAAAMQAEVARIAREHGLALVGPNCMGVIDLTSNAATYIGDVSPYLPKGGVAGIAQSGSVADAFVHSGSRVGFSRIVSCGSEVVLDVCDFLAYCLDDPETSSVILFVEGFKRPERFLALADRALELGKPIMAVKVGRSEQAQVAAIAHSGSLAGEARATDAALDAAGVIRCADLDELLETAELVEGMRRTGRSIGRGRTGVVTVSTGEASLVADQAAADRGGPAADPGVGAGRHPGRAPDHGLRRQPAGPVGRRRPGHRLRGDVRGDGRVGRLRRAGHRPRLPVPLAAVRGGHRQRRRVPAAGGDRGPAVDPAHLRLADLRRAAARDEGAARHQGRRRAAAARRPRGVHRDREHGPLGGAPRPAPEARTVAGRLARARRGPRQLRPRPSAAATGDRGSRSLSERDSLALLGDAGHRRDRGHRSPRTPPRPSRRRGGYGRPVALKLEATGLAHKSDHGGVVLGLSGDDAVYARGARDPRRRPPPRLRRPRPARGAHGRRRGSS